MPLKRCKKDGVSGWKWGDSGACYTGKDARKQALKQGLAISGPKKFRQEMQKTKAGSEEWAEMAEALREYKEENAPPTYAEGIIESVRKQKE